MKAAHYVYISTDGEKSVRQKSGFKTQEDWVNESCFILQ
jgi:hypothetical protein